MQKSTKRIGWLLIGFAVMLAIALSLIKTSLDKRDAFLCETFHANQLDMEQCPAHQSNTSWLFVMAFGITFFILASGVYLIFMPIEIMPIEKEGKKEEQEVKKVEFKEIDTSRFDEGEKKIYELLKQYEGSMYQSDLIKETGFSKVKITRLLDKMTFKGILERKRRGMTNIIVLK